MEARRQGIEDPSAVSYIVHGHKAHGAITFTRVRCTSRIARGWGDGEEAARGKEGKREAKKRHRKDYLGSTHSKQTLH